MGSSQTLDSTYWSPAEHSTSAFQNFESSPNVFARMSATWINALFRTSDGHLKHRYANNQPRFELTDVFGQNDPEIISSGDFDIALAIRGTPTRNGGFCGFYAGHPNFRCCNNNGDGGMNWRRYNALKEEDAWCTAIHGYSNNHCNPQRYHGPVGDTYGCNVGGVRNVAGHMWWTYTYSGAPCSNYGGYRCYGSRWIR